jgi:spermidine synthase
LRIHTAPKKEGVAKHRVAAHDKRKDHATPRFAAVLEEEAANMSGTIDSLTTWARANKARARIVWVGAILLLGIGLVSITPNGASEGLPPGVHMVDHVESAYNDVRVYEQGQIVEMTFGHNQKLYEESAADTAHPRTLPVEYTRWMTVAAAYPPTPGRILEIGAGGGTTAWYLHEIFPKAQVTSVDLDPAVMDLAKKYFKVRDEPGHRMVVADGRNFLRDHPNDKWDLIALDAYRGPFVPYHLLTQEFLQLVRDRLTPEGALVQNIDPSTMLFDSAVRTIATVFPEVDLYRTDPSHETNIVVVAWNGPRPGDSGPAKRAEAIDATIKPTYPLTDMIAHRIALDNAGNAVDPKAKVLVDDFAPTEALKAIEQHNRKWAEGSTGQ